ncbi:MAG: MoxR family ATPase [Myxococcota bacterium]|nr:MoxR family ATPase [Myxococcota bacterium]
MQSPASLKKDVSGLGAAEIAAKLERCVADIGRVVRGQRPVIELLMATVMARGHVLLDDVPGVGKTTLARAVASVLGSEFSRVQFTADMLPGDILGVHRPDPRTGEVAFEPGPIMCELVLADEINRASPRTQSAMLEAMAERAVTVDGSRFPLPSTFTVIATQNPVEHHGAYPLPESQLDRFMVSLSLGYPDRASERALLENPTGPAGELEALETMFEAGELEQLSARVEQVVVSEAVADYVLAIAEATRSHANILLGVSPRATMALSVLARSRALFSGRDFVVPDDIKWLVASVFGHRIVTTGGTGTTRRYQQAILEEILAQIPVPR